MPRKVRRAIFGLIPYGEIKKSCLKKQRHASRGAAEAAIRSLIKQDFAVERIEPYPCAVCGGWHVGHRKKSRFTK